MGMYDTVMHIMPCGRCHRLRQMELQTKDFGNIMAEMKSYENIALIAVPADWTDGTFECHTICGHCGYYISYTAHVKDSHISKIDTPIWKKDGGGMKNEFTDWD